MKKISTLFILIAIFGSANGQLQELIKTTENSIFSVFTFDEAGSPTGIGTGFFISSDGTALTNFHVLNGSTTGVIKTIDGKTFPIESIVGSSEKADIVKFKVDTKGAKVPYLITKTLIPDKGEKIFVIGNPHGLESSVSEGIVSSVRDSEDYGSILQITAPISPGSSGSPVMTLDGKVVGVATFQFTHGQNLNFAVGIKAIQSLNSSSAIFVSSRPDLLIINERCKSNSELILNSIEFGSSITTLNFSFTNVSMGFGPRMNIWTSFKEEDETFVIQDLNTMQRYYATASTIGLDREHGTDIDLGETKRFKVFFPAIPKSLKRVNIMEGLASSWQFLDLDLSKYVNIETQSTDDHVKNIALVKLENKKFEEAKVLLGETVETNKADHDAYNLLGIISYIVDNNYDALLYFNKAIEVAPNNPIYYFNRYRLNFEHRKDYEGALKDINSAIRILPTQGDYYQYRAYVHMALKDWKKAVTDWDMAINLMGEHATLLIYRGNCKTWLEDFSGACRDWKEANKLSGYSNKELQAQIKKYCR